LCVCDTCGTALSDDSAAHCYSAEPKRSCPETHPTDSSALQCNGVTSNTSGAAVVSTVSPSTSDSLVRPQALYVNVNNQAYPVLGVTAASTSTQSRPTVTASTNVNSLVSHPTTASIFASTTHASSAAATRAILQSTEPRISQPWPSAVIGSVTVTQTAAPPAYAHNTLHSQQPPTQSVASNVPPRLPVTAPHSSVQAPTTIVSGASSAYVFQVNAVQIRLGTKKFKPLTAVTFKDDGVLFTLNGTLVVTKLI